MKKISVIIPVYNAELYLCQCLSSVISQTYGNLEIICVDDGSTDNSGEIVDEFAREDTRIIAIHQQNMGESKARNAGIVRATGDYIAFVDCDDWIEPDMYETLVSALENNDVDISAVNWIKEFSDRSIYMKNKLPVSTDKLSRNQLMYYFYRRDDYQGLAYMWNKLYRRELIYQSNEKVLFFEENLKLGGDVVYLAELLLKANSGVYVDKAYYHYRQRDTSGCHTLNLGKRLDWLEAYKIVIQKFEQQGVSDEVMIWVKRFLAYHSSNVAELAYQQSENKVLNYCQNIMRQYEKEYHKTNEIYVDRIRRYDKILNL